MKNDWPIFSLSYFLSLVLTIVFIVTHSWHWFCTLFWKKKKIKEKKDEIVWKKKILKYDEVLGSSFKF